MYGKYVKTGFTLNAVLIVIVSMLYSIIHFYNSMIKLLEKVTYFDIVVACLDI